MNVPRRLRGISGGRCGGGAPRPSGAGSTRHDGRSPLRAGCSRSGAGVEEEGGRGIRHRALYISLATSSMKRG